MATFPMPSARVLAGRRRMVCAPADCVAIKRPPSAAQRNLMEYPHVLNVQHHHWTIPKPEPFGCHRHQPYMNQRRTAISTVAATMPKIRANRNTALGDGSFIDLQGPPLTRERNEHLQHNTSLRQAAATRNAYRTGDGKPRTRG